MRWSRGIVSPISAFRITRSLGRTMPAMAATTNTAVGVRKPASASSESAAASSTYPARIAHSKARPPSRSPRTPNIGAASVPRNWSDANAVRSSTDPVSTSTYQPRISVSISNAHDVSRSAGHWNRKLRTRNGANGGGLRLALTAPGQALYSTSLRAVGAEERFGQQADHRIEVSGIRLEAHAESADGADHGVVERRLHANASAFLADVAVQIVDLGPPPLHHVLQQARLAAASRFCNGRNIGQQLLETAAGVRVEIPLHGDTVDRLHLVADASTDRDGLRAKMNADRRDLRDGPDLERPESGEAGQRIRHAVDRQLGPPLAPEVGRDLALGDGIQEDDQLSRTGGVLAVVLADLEPDRPRIRPHGMAGLVHAGADRDDTAERPARAGDSGDAAVVDAVLEIDHDPVGLAQIGQCHRGRPFRIIGLHRDEHRVEGLGHGLELVDVQGAHGHHEVADRA